MIPVESLVGVDFHRGILRGHIVNIGIVLDAQNFQHASRRHVVEVGAGRHILERSLVSYPHAFFIISLAILLLSYESVRVLLLSVLSFTASVDVVLLVFRLV